MSNSFRFLTRYIKYASSTLVGTLVDMSVLWLLSVELLHGHIGEYIISPCISFECAVIANYLVAYHFVWKDQVLLHPQKNGWYRFFKYNGTCILGFSIKMCILLLLKHLFQWNVLLCNIVALLFSGGLNFLLQHFWVFSQQRCNYNHNKGTYQSVSQYQNSHKYTQREEVQSSSSEVYTVYPMARKSVLLRSKRNAGFASYP